MHINAQICVIYTTPDSYLCRKHKFETVKKLICIWYAATAKTRVLAWFGHLTVLRASIFVPH